MHVSAAFAGLTPNTRQGWHIHTFGDTGTSDGKSTGGHFASPWRKVGQSNTKHGYPGSKIRHWGDLGNLVVDSSGRAWISRFDNMLKIEYIVGRGMIIHAFEDKGPGAQPSGSAGKRVAQCVIGYANPEMI